MRKLSVAAALAVITFSLPLVAAPTMAATGNYDDYDRWVYVYNNSDYEIEYVYSANPGESYFDGVDLLDTHQTILPGEGAFVSVEDDTGYCQYWVQVKFADGAKSTSEDTLNVCHYGTGNAPTLRVNY